MALYLLIGGWWFLTGDGLLDRSGKPLGGDFITFYAASELALDGAPAAVFDLERLHAVEQAVMGVALPRFAWHYPPVALLGVLGFALVPFGAALAFTTLASLGLYAGALWSLAKRDLAAPDLPVLLGLGLAFPGLFQDLIHGQNGCLSAALLGLGLLRVDRAPLQAGALLGCLVYKPHLTPIVVVALLAGRRWRALAATGLTALALCALSLAAFGLETWQAFVDNIPFASAVLYEGGVPWEKMPTTSAALLLAGASPAAAKAGQLLVSASAAGAVGWLWWREAAAPLRFAGVTAGALLATPFAFEYDLAILALPMAWLGVEVTRDGPRPGELALLGLAYLMPIFAPGLAALTGAQLGPLVIAAVLALALRRAAEPSP